MNKESRYENKVLVRINSHILQVLLRRPIINSSSITTDYIITSHFEISSMLDNLPTIQQEYFTIALQRLFLGMYKRAKILNHIRNSKYSPKLHLLEKFILNRTKQYVDLLTEDQISHFLPQLLDKELMTNGDYCFDLPKFEPIELKIRKSFDPIPYIRGFTPPFMFISSSGFYCPN